MANYTNVIDAFLNDREPDWQELGLQDAKDSGDEQLDRTHEYVDKAFMDDIAEGASHHTPIIGPKTSAAKPVQSAAEVRKARLDAARAGAARPSVTPNAVGGYRQPRTAIASSPADYKAEYSDESLFDEVTHNITKARGNANAKPGVIENKGHDISDNEARKYVAELLNQGVSPKKVSAALKKLAEVALYNKGLAQEYLNNSAGFLGLAYIEPNQFMDNCPSTYERMNKRTGGKGSKAASVKQVMRGPGKVACVDCSFFKKGIDGSKTCNLYHKPIVGSVEEMRPIINKLTAGVPKEHKRAALTKIANGENMHVRVATQSPMISRAPEPINQDDAQFARQAATAERLAVQQPHFNGAVAMAWHAKGASLEKIYTVATRKVGSVAASRGIKEFIASLKKTGSRIVLSQIDCTFLKQKLGERNMIVGASKCGSCTYRSGMHCGLTGGTLLSFPGMDRVAANHTIAEDAPEDARAMLSEYELSGPMVDNTEIDISEPERLEVETGSTFALDVE